MFVLKNLLKDFWISAKKGKKTKKTDDKKKQSSDLRRLNDECLYTIFAYCDVGLLRQLEKVCPRFNDIINRKMYSRCKKLDFIELKNEYKISIYSSEAKVIARKVGAHVNKFKITTIYHCHKYVNIGPEVIPRSILKNLSTNLQHLIIAFYNLKNSADLLNGLYPNLKTLILIGCHLRDEHFDGLKSATNLRVINLGMQEKITGHFLPFLRNMYEVSLSTCHSLQQRYLVEMCVNNPTLRILNISNCKQIDQEGINYVETLKNLHAVTIGGNLPVVNVKILTQLPLLNHLALRCYSVVNYREVLEDLARRDQLKFLNVTSYPDPTVLRTVTKFSNLKILKIHNSDLKDCAFDHEILCKDTLQTLCITNCANLRSDILLKFVMTCKFLKIIDIRQCRNIIGFAENFLNPFPPRSVPLEILVAQTKLVHDMKVKQHPNMKYIKFNDQQKLLLGVNTV
ncbi:hypothetical protein DMENIID0001_119130 [Sergentomyia squamirostris]